MSTRPMPCLRSGPNLMTIEFTAGDRVRAAEVWLWMRGFAYGPVDHDHPHRAVLFRDRLLGGKLPRWSALAPGAETEVDGRLTVEDGRVVVEIFATACPEAIAAALGRDVVRIAA